MRQNHRQLVNILSYDGLLPVAWPHQAIIWTNVPSQRASNKSSVSISCCIYAHIVFCLHWKALEKDMNMFRQRRDRLQQAVATSRTRLRTVPPATPLTPSTDSKDEKEQAKLGDPANNVIGDENDETDDVISPLPQGEDNVEDDTQHVHKRRMSTPLGLVTPHGTHVSGGCRFATRLPTKRCLSAPAANRYNSYDEVTSLAKILFPRRSPRPTPDLIEYHNAQSEILATKIDTFLENIDDFTSIPEPTPLEQITPLPVSTEDDQDDVKQTKLNFRVRLRTPSVAFAPQQIISEGKTNISANKDPYTQLYNTGTIANDINKHNGIYLATPTKDTLRKGAIRRPASGKKKCLSARETRRVTTKHSPLQDHDSREDGDDSNYAVQENQDDHAIQTSRLLKSREQRRSVLMNAWDTFRAEGDFMSFKKLSDLVTKEKANRLRRMKSAFY